MRKIKNSIKGFTLIELLIVIAIIGVLATLLMANFIGVRQRARDAQRKSDLRQIQAALEIWRSDKGSYPVASSEYPGTCGSGTSLVSGSTTYMASIPCDPSGGAYVYSGGGTSYTLYTCLENAADSQKDDTKQSGCSTPASFTVTNP